MSGILLSIVSFILVIGVLVTFHEYGHFWVARKLGVRVTRFSIGFGKPILRWRGKHNDTEYVLAQIPLGGYVKMLDERDEPVADEDLPYVFNRKPVLARMAITFAGPLFNFILAIFVYWLVFVIGIEGLKPVVGSIEPDSTAQQAGLQPGDHITAVNAVETANWDGIGLQLIEAVLDRDASVRISVRDEHLQEHVRTLNIRGLSPDLAKGNILLHTGIRPLLPTWPAIIESVVEGDPAAQAGLQTGDKVLSVAGEAVDDWRDWVQYLRARPGEQLQVQVLRDGQTRDISLHVGNKTDDSVSYGYIGAIARAPQAIPPELRSVLQYSPLTAVVPALEKTAQLSLLTLRMLGKMLVGEVSVKNISGPITIAQYAGQSASIGLVQFLAFIAIVSVSLGVLNLLPIPVLDGGHLMYYLIELLKGSPVTEKTQMLGQQIGVVMLAMLMILALYNDVMRLF
ncbi:RIP metalloprotease RseP [Sulfuriflexus mobilis]|uniref:RIP metalloprotease RseP n=1 Tax=Sulfuriflexus mobilis TaxID=1811807 RepID=UPI000F842916|nr:RIP metalloprotease RseP [Sulfuriflexus mobilis]